MTYHTTTQDINKIINALKNDNDKGHGRTPAKFIKLSANVIDNHLPNIINNDIVQNNYTEKDKTANIMINF